VTLTAGTTYTEEFEYTLTGAALLRIEHIEGRDQYRVFHLLGYGIIAPHLVPR